jgi:acyl-CoA reductase-like NAD-dependent aldehyde dehydrogenase
LWWSKENNTCGKLGAVIDKASQERIENYITQAEKAGAKIVVDGRNAKVLVKKNGTMLDQRLLIMSHQKWVWGFTLLFDEDFFL